MTRRSLIPSLIPFGFRKDLEPVSWLRQEVDNLFDNFWRSSSLQPSLSLYEKGFSLTPDIDVCETNNELTVVVDLPGLEEKDIHVEINKDVLSIRGEKKIDREEKGKNFHCIERVSGSFNRSIQLPTLINEDNVKANFKNGVLTIILPKSAEAKTKAKQITVKKG